MVNLYSWLYYLFYFYFYFFLIWFAVRRLVVLFLVSEDDTSVRKYVCGRVETWPRSFRRLTGETEDDR